MSKRKLAELVVVELAEYKAQLNVYMICCGYPEHEAQALAWIDLQAKFPRLREFDGCKP